ncbi:MAG TPA: hypothetical protein VFB37_12900 [Steroidobacteraceae bacterium]|nr:hypothetical protein [Steroidobacteraceae bacterium]
MAAPTLPSVLIPIAVALLIAWRFYSRVRRTIGRQRFSAVRPWITVTLFPLLIVLLLLGNRAHTLPTLALPALLGGAVLGVALGVYGLRLTRFEQTPEGLFYTPSAHLGIILSVILLLRIGYRMAQGYLAFGSSAPPPGNAQSPLTLLIFGAFAGYYVTYAIGLLLWHRRVREGGLTSADNTTGS